jgi:hypothetical protein
MTRELLAAQRELLLARIALQRARLVLEASALRATVSGAIPALHWAQTIGALLQPASSGTAPAKRRATSWIGWALLAQHLLRLLSSLRQAH